MKKESILSGLELAEEEILRDKVLNAEYAIYIIEALKYLVEKEKDNEY